MAMAKLICEVTVGGEQVIRSFTTPSFDSAAALAKTYPGVGNPFWVWASVPSGQIIGVDFTDAPNATSSTSTNLSQIQAITATPEEKLIYAG